MLWEKHPSGKIKNCKLAGMWLKKKKPLAEWVHTRSKAAFEEVALIGERCRRSFPETIQSQCFLFPFLQTAAAAAAAHLIKNITLREDYGGSGFDALAVDLHHGHQ